jgi:hypothetical protein
MIAGSIRLSYEGKGSDKEVYKNLVKKHLEDEWKFK